MPEYDFCTLRKSYNTPGIFVTIKCVKFVTDKEKASQFAQELHELVQKYIDNGLCVYQKQD